MVSNLKRNFSKARKAMPKKYKNLVFHEGRKLIDE
jgi:hypothetical protein